VFQASNEKVAERGADIEDDDVPATGFKPFTRLTKKSVEVR
jgi:hypothetical protein